MNLTNPTLPPVTDLDALRTAVASALSNLVTQINQTGVTDNLDVGGNRVTNVATPTGPNDAVNKRYLHSVVGTTTNIGKKGVGSGKDAYTIVFSASVINANDATPDFVVGLDRTGVAKEAWIYAVDGPIGTGGFVANIAKNGTNILASNLVVGTGSNGPVFITSFTGDVSLAHGDLVSLVVTSSGGAAGVSVGLVVKR